MFTKIAKPLLEGESTLHLVVCRENDTELRVSVHVMDPKPDAGAKESALSRPVTIVDTPENLGARMYGLKSAGSLYFPIIFAAFEVVPKPKLGPRSAETSVHNILTNRGLFSSGEIFLAPGGSIRQLLVEVESAMRDLDLEFVPIDIKAMAEDFDAKNRDVLERLYRKRTVEATCPYEVWRGNQNDGLASNGGTYDPSRDDSLRDLTALGYILADVAVGSAEVIRMDLGDFGEMRVFPAQSLEAALFEARAEQNLALPISARRLVTGAVSDQMALRPVAIEFLLRETFSKIAIPGPFLKDQDCQENAFRLTPGHLACLGDLTASPGQFWTFFGSETRAPLSPEAYRLARQDPSLLPGLRFWAGTEHAFERGFRVYGYELPILRQAYEPMLRRAAEALKGAGQPVAEATIEWVFNAWLAVA